MVKSLIKLEKGPKCDHEIVKIITRAKQVASKHIMFNVAQLFIFSVVKFLFLLKLNKIVSLTRIFESLDFKKTTWKIFNSLNYNLVDLPKEIKNIYQRYL